MQSILTNDNSNQIKILYDGECVLCSNYVVMMRLKKNIELVELIDARKNLNYVKEMKKIGLDINQGMLVIYGNNKYFGSEAVHILSILSASSNIIMKLINFFFSSKIMASIIYPFCKISRMILLKFNGRKMIEIKNL